METIYRTAAEPWELKGDVGNRRVVVKVLESVGYVRVRADAVGGSDGEISFEIMLSAFGHSEIVTIRVRSEGEPIANHGDGDLWRLFKLVCLPGAERLCVGNHWQRKGIVPEGAKQPGI